MKVDVAAEIRAYMARQEAAASDANIRALMDSDAELRLVTAILCDRGVLEQCDDVELEDFADLRARAMFTAIRTLQARGEAVDPLTVGDEIKRTDRNTGRRVSERVDDFYIAMLVLTQHKHSENSLAHARRRLREMAVARRQA